jgi:hypothetical protein
MPGITESEHFTFEPSPGYLSETLPGARRLSKASSAAHSTARRVSQDKSEDANIAKLNAESSRVGRSKWENAEETQVCGAGLFFFVSLFAHIVQAVKHAEEAKNQVREEKKRKAKAELEAAAAAESQRRFRRSQSKESKVVCVLEIKKLLFTLTLQDVEAPSVSFEADVAIPSSRSGSSAKKWNDAADTQVTQPALSTFHNAVCL